MELMTLGRAALEEGSLDLDVPAKGRFMALDRDGLYWCRAQSDALPAKKVTGAQFLLVEQEPGGVLDLWLPLISGDLYAWMEAEDGKWTLRWSGALPGEVPDSAVLLLRAGGSDMHSLVRDVLSEVKEMLGSFTMRSSKPEPAFMDELLWCTWEAFFRDLDEQKTKAGLESFALAGVRLGGMVLDDGWLDAEGDLLNDLGPHPDRFPSGLASLIHFARRQGLRQIGIWHAMTGYWAGVKPGGRAASEFRTVPNQGDIRPWNPSISELNLIHPEDASRFYSTRHKALRAAGVDFVKVDGQSSLEVFTKGKLGRCSSMAAYQQALQSSVQHHFKGGLIHCMPHGSDVVYNLQSTNVMRSSDDYFHKRPEGHGVHLWWNAAMALWIGDICWPDWDMFMTQHPQGWFHAAARAMSGGPIMIADRPGEHDVELIRALALPDGRVLRPSRPALPIRESVFADPVHNPAPLVIENRCGGIGVVGAFHCMHSGPAAQAALRPQDVHDLSLSHQGCVAYRVSDGAILACPEAGVQASLEEYGWEIIVFSPRLGWITPIGREGALLPPALFGRLEMMPTGILLAEVKAPGRVVFAASSAPYRVEMEDGILEVEHAGGKVVIQAPRAGTMLIHPPRE